MKLHLLWYLLTKLVHFNSTFGSSHIASSAYQKWPTKSHSFYLSVEKIIVQLRNSDPLGANAKKMISYLFKV